MNLLLDTPAFDRMLVAQSEIEKATLVTCDGAFAEFNTQVLW